jgi:hypothetical protein
MSGNDSDPNKRNGVVTRCKWHPLKNLFKNLTARPPWRLGKSPDPKNSSQESAPPTAVKIQASATVAELQLDGHDETTVETAEPPSPQAKPESKTAHASSSEHCDMWERAERRLRKDKKMAEILDASHQIVGSTLGLTLESIGSTEACEKIRQFLDSEREKAEKRENLPGCRKHINEALTGFSRAFLALNGIINAVAMASPPAYIACASATVLHSVSSLL